MGHLQKILDEELLRLTVYYQRYLAIRISSAQREHFTVDYVIVCITRHVAVEVCMQTMTIGISWRL